MTMAILNRDICLIEAVFTKLWLIMAQLAPLPILLGLTVQIDISIFIVEKHFE